MEENKFYISGEGKLSDIPDEIRGWNWGAFFLTFLWGIYNKVYISFFCIIPFVTPFMAFVLGAKGSVWSWRKRKWISVEHFKIVQRKWAWWGFGIFVFAVLMSIIGLIFEVLGYAESREMIKLLKYYGAKQY